MSNILYADLQFARYVGDMEPGEVAYTVPWAVQNGRVREDNSIQGWHSHPARTVCWTRTLYSRRRNARISRCVTRDGLLNDCQGRECVI